MELTHATHYIHVNVKGGHFWLDLHVDPLVFITPTPSSRTNPLGSPARPFGHNKHVSTTRCTSSPTLEHTNNHYCCQKQLAYCLAAKWISCCCCLPLLLPAVTVALLSREYVPMAKARACSGCRLW